MSLRLHAEPSSAPDDPRNTRLLRLSCSRWLRPPPVPGARRSPRSRSVFASTEHMEERSTGRSGLRRRRRFVHSSDRLGWTLTGSPDRGRGLRWERSGARRSAVASSDAATWAGTSPSSSSCSPSTDSLPARSTVASGRGCPPRCGASSDGLASSPAGADPPPRSRRWLRRRRGSRFGFEARRALRRRDRFGPRGDRFHTGIDYPAQTGAPVVAAAAGRVTWAGWRTGGWGLLVVVDHGRGLRTLYAHLSRAHVVVGQRLLAGSLLGRVGASGRSSGPHLHFEARIRGAAVDPGPALGG